MKKQSVKKKLLWILFPHRCPFCGSITEKDVCTSCVERLKWASEPRCKKCGKPIRQDTKEYCYDCAREEKHFDRGLALWVHTNEVKTAIYALKYGNKRYIAEYFGEEIYRSFKSQLMSWNPDIIVPVPISSERMRKRGYNQAELIAKKLSELSGIPMEKKAVKRVKDTAPQKGLDRSGRRRNLQKAFVVNAVRCKGQRVLVIDDIYTTGATIDIIAQKLKQNGVNKVYFITISIGQGF